MVLAFAIGDKIGAWTVIDIWPRGRYVCRCACGAEKIKSAGALHVAARQKSAGCRRCLGRRMSIHGETDTEMHIIWQGIVARCTQSSNTAFPRYGARGIRVAATWLGPTGYVRFKEYIGPRPSPAHSIDRIDGRGNYEPGNVRWATPKEQARNMRTNRRLCFGGLNLPCSEWAERLGMDWRVFHRRLTRGWSVQRAIITPLRPWPKPKRKTAC